MNLLSTIIDRLNQRIEAGNIFDQIYGLSELSADGNDKAWIHYIGNGQAIPVTNFDAKQGTLFWAKRGKISVAKIETFKLAGCKSMYETRYSLSANAVVRKSHLPCDSADAQDWIASRVLKLISGTDPQFKTAIGVVSYEVVPNGYANEIKSLPPNYEWASVTIDVDINVVSGSEDGCYDTCATGDIPLPDFEPCTPCLTEVAVDGVTIIGNGTPADPLTAIGGGGGTPLITQEDGTNVSTNTTTLNFTGDGVTASLTSPGVVEVNIPSGGGGGGVTSVTGTAPIASSGGATPDISISQAGIGTDGYVSSADWATFNGKQDALTAGTGIDLSGNIVTNTAPDQVVSITAGSDIAVSGTYPSFTIDNTAPDQIVSITGGTDISVSGTYPNFTIDNTADLSGYVPYTGATGDVDLGTHKLTADAVEFSLTPTNSPGSGQIAYVGNTGALAYNMNGSAVTSQIGQTMHALVHNADSVTINKGQAVYLFGASGNKASVKLANNTGDATSAKTLGLAAENITSGQNGFIIVQGVLDGLNTGAYNAGDTLYLGATAGALTSTKPYAPNHLVYIGVVEKANNGNGQIYVRVQNGYELDEIHDVDLITTPPVNNDVLTYVTGSPNLWKNRSIGSILGGNNTQYVRGDGTLATFPAVPAAVSVYPYQRTNYYKPTDNRDIEYYNNNIFMINNSGNNVTVIDATTTLTTVTTGGLTSPNQSSVITDLATVEVWATGGITQITRHNASTGAFIANTAPTGSLTNASGTRYVSYSATKAVGGNTASIFVINPATFVTSNLVAHGIGAIIPHLDVNKNSLSAQNDHVMMGGPNGIILFNCTTNAIVLAATTLAGAIGPVYDIKYDASNDNWVVVCTIGGIIKIVLLRPLTATTFTVIKTIDSYSIFGNTLTPGNTQNIKIEIDETYQYLFVVSYSRLYMYNLSNGDLLKTLNPVMISGGNIQSASAIDKTNKRIFICTGGAANTITYEYIYA
jgi:hypothetical protein